MNKTHYIKLLAISMGLGIVQWAHAQVKPSKLFASGMVLQREAPIPVWGTAPAGDSITVFFGGNKASDVAGQGGTWKVVLPAVEAGGPFKMTIARATDTIRYTDVYVGDVFFAGGQSNMEFTVKQAAGAAATISSTNLPTIREFKIDKAYHKEPQTLLNSAKWSSATSANVGNFSAVAFYFARELQKSINVPIGIINPSYGGSRIEAWMSDEMLGYDEDDVKLAQGEVERQPTLIFNKMVNPIVGVPLKGMLWYQGESNADVMSDAVVYGEQFKNLIRSYRQLWGMGNIPFVWIQLPNQDKANVETAPQVSDVWPQLRANQSRALSLPNTAEVNIIDLGEVDIHPTNKIPVGERLALAVRKLVYEHDIVAFGPRYASHTLLDSGRVKVEFSSTGGRLMAKNTTSDSLRWFTCAGADGVLRKATAVISGSSVIVSCKEVADIKMIRYAWERNPLGVNFYNEENLPASPFKITVPTEGFAIKKFTSSKRSVERGQGVVLEWDVAGAQKVMLNGLVQDHAVAVGLWPKDSTTYKLQAINMLDTLTREVYVAVTDPLPRISIKTLMGNVTIPGEEVTVIADATAPGGESVVKVEFYIDNKLVSTDDSYPYQLLWKDDNLGTYSLKATVTNSKGAIATSGAIFLYVSDLTRTRFEAEDAKLTGVGAVKSGTAASNGKYMELQEPFSLTFSVSVPQAGEYQTIIRYLLNFDPLKEQNLLVNGSAVKTIRFEASDKTSWLDYGLMLKLKEGVNTITIEKSWGWMSFDYIDVLGALKVASNDAPTLPVAKGSLLSVQEGDDLVITYSVESDATIYLRLIDNKGIVCKSSISKSSPSGTGISAFNIGDLQRGTYVVSLTSGFDTLSIKTIIK